MTPEEWEGIASNKLLAVWGPRHFPEFKLRAYYEDLQGFPTDAIEKAVVICNRGAGEWPPTLGQIRTITHVHLQYPRFPPPKPLPPPAPKPYVEHLRHLVKGRLQGIITQAELEQEAAKR